MSDPEEITEVSINEGLSRSLTYCTKCQKFQPYRYERFDDPIHPRVYLVCDWCGDKSLTSNSARRFLLAPAGTIVIRQERPALPPVILDPPGIDDLIFTPEGCVDIWDEKPVTQKKEIK
jgi:hypothetical protein